MSDPESSDVVLHPKEAALCFAIGPPLLAASTYLDGWAEWVVGGPGAVMIFAASFWLAFVITNALALAIEGESLAEIMGVDPDE